MEKITAAGHAFVLRLAIRECARVLKDHRASIRLKDKLKLTATIDRLQQPLERAEMAKLTHSVARVLDPDPELAQRMARLRQQKAEKAQSPQMLDTQVLET